jgi:hypothetical protein
MQFNRLFQTLMENISDEYINLINEILSTPDVKKRNLLISRAQNMLHKKRVGSGYNIFPVFHGSGSLKKFTSFTKTKSHRSTSIMGFDDNYEIESPVFFFTDNKNLAFEFAKNRSDHPADMWVHENLALKIKNPLNIYDNYRIVSNILKKHNITVPTKLQSWQLFDNPNIVDIFKSMGYDGAIIPERDASKLFGVKQSNKTYIVFEPNQIKSGAEITRDDSGNIIPLSKRFNPDSDDIRY